MGIFWVNLLEVNADFVMLFEVAKSANIFSAEEGRAPCIKNSNKFKEIIELSLGMPTMLE